MVAIPLERARLRNFSCLGTAAGTAELAGGGRRQLTARRPSAGLDGDGPGTKTAFSFGFNIPVFAGVMANLACFVVGYAPATGIAVQYNRDEESEQSPRPYRAKIRPNELKNSTTPRVKTINVPLQVL